MSNVKAENASKLRYKRPALSSLGYYAITSELCQISEACSDVHWFMDNDEETLLNALDGDSEAEYEFKMTFSDLEAKAEQLEGAMNSWDICDEFDNCTVALIGNAYKIVGYDSFEEDYFSLIGYDSELAYTESGQKLMRKTKKDIISTVGQCLGIVIAFLDLRQTYDYLKATFDILRDENTSLLQAIKAIDDAYEKANAVEFDYCREETKQFDRLLAALPEMTWLE